MNTIDLSLIYSQIYSFYLSKALYGTSIIKGYKSGFEFYMGHTIKLGSSIVIIICLKVDVGLHITLFVFF